MTTFDNHSVEHLTRRLDVALPLPYERAVQRYEELVPPVDRARFGQLADWDAVRAFAEINAPHGFMIYWSIDITAIMAGSPSGWKCTEYLMGNHVIAERMFRHDPSAVLHAPCARSSTRTRRAPPASRWTSRAPCSTATATPRSRRWGRSSTSSSRTCCPSWALHHRRNSSPEGKELVPLRTWN